MEQICTENKNIGKFEASIISSLSNNELKLNISLQTSLKK